MFFADVDEALQIAERFGIRIVFALFDFHWFYPAQFHNGVQMGGRARFITDTRLRKHLLSNVVQPILARYGSHPAIHSWDVFNEPEWILRGIRSWRFFHAASVRKFRSFLNEVVQLIHNESIHPATLGLARRRSLTLFQEIQLDYLQLHWYDKQKDELWIPLQNSIPVVLGEFPTAGSRLSVDKILRHAQDAGFAGAFAWSVKSSVRFSSLPSLLSGLTAFRKTLPLSAFAS
jgi:hypothetical protein